MEEREINFTSGNLRLEGTLTSPYSGAQFPGVLLIPGSGRIDRNQNHETIKTNIFLDIANNLAQQGFASLRYDKRGVGLSEGNLQEGGFFDNVADASAALSYLQTCEEIVSERVFLLGTSEGAVISTRMAGQGADVAGVILLAGMSKSGEDTLKWQAEQIIEGEDGQSKWDQFRTYLNATMPPKWLGEFMDYDPIEDLSRIRIPVLAITGSKDIQADPQDLKQMAEIVSADFEYHELPDVTHILRIDKGKPSLSTYEKQLQQSIDSGVLHHITDWLQKRS